ncbi:hypothetical protein [Flyfo microvirus Tbat2_105]|nr:hypothetical protein [Flyfo microvirus Tbat2_105]
MVVKLNSLARWAYLDPKEAIVFEGTKDNERLIRLHLNLEAVTSLYIEDEVRGTNFLCTMQPGVDVLEFYVSGDFRVFAEEGSGVVHYQSADLEPTFSEVVDPVIFTKIANRRHRNPELEEIMYRAQANMERRFAQQAGEMEAAFERRLREVENGRPAETVKSNAPGAAAQGDGDAVLQQKPAGEKPLENAGSGPSGEQQSGTGSGQAGTGSAS